MTFTLYPPREARGAAGAGEAQPGVVPAVTGSLLTLMPTRRMPQTVISQAGGVHTASLALPSRRCA